MAITNTYAVNGEMPITIMSGAVDIDMSREDGVMAGCKEYPIPLLNKITVESRDGALFKSRTIYAGYKVVQQMLGSLIRAGNYKTSDPLLSTIISIGRFGIFEPAHYNPDTRSWNIHNLGTGQISSLMNIGTGIKICVKIEYTKVDLSVTTVYVDVPGAVSGKVAKTDDVVVPHYGELGVFNLAHGETVGYKEVDNYAKRSWFEFVLTRDILNVNLSSSIVNPDITKDMTITLMAYIGSTPTADNTFTILPMTANSQTSITVAFENENFDPLIKLYNKDGSNNPDTYADGYGSVADYDSGSSIDTTIKVEIIAT